VAVEIHFEHGTIVVPKTDEVPEAVDKFLSLDQRSGSYRAPAQQYRDLVLTLKRDGVDFDDRARRFDPLALELTKKIDPFPHQAEALEKWWTAGRRGIVELPTGAGKTILAVLAMARVQRPTLVVVPTIDLLTQWSKVLEEFFGESIGMLGGGSHDRQPITVATYDSAQMQIEFIGNHFGFLVCDECHHLPAPAYRFIAEGSIAPFRLGLTATLERTDGGEQTAMNLLGPLVHQVGIETLEGDYLAPYDLESVGVHLSEEEQARYDASRSQYLTFLRGSGVRLDRPQGWAQFIMRAHQSDEGRAAFRAYREQKRIAIASEAKLAALWAVLVKHREDRTIVFTEDNETVYRLSRRFMFPAITHQTKAPERKHWLTAFAKGDVRVLLTSKVLNEGVDVPEANVGVVLSGSGSVREHVQRLGRILRKRPGKRAVLYEIFTEVAAEVNITERRRQHRAYQKDEPC
jgi:superfamily II DNA or RNA helicase